MSALNELANLVLHPKTNPRDARTWEAIQEVAPRLQEILDDHKYTEEDVVELAEKEAEVLARRESGREQAQEDAAAQSQEAQDRIRERIWEIENRILELAAHGPLRLSMLRPILKREGYTNQQLLEVRRSERLRFFEVGDEGIRYVEARQEEPQPA